MQKTTNVGQPFTVAIIGASGFVGQNLLRYLLKETDYLIRAVCRSPHNIIFDQQYSARVQLVAADIFDYDAIEKSLEGINAAVYLIHMMAAKGDYYDLEAKAAETFGRATQHAGLPRAVFMGGLGDDADRLSRHLQSRHNTGKILKNHVPLLIEFRASMIVGDGSIAYDIMKSLVHNLPVQTVPAWAVTHTQPIALQDALQYLSSSLTVPLRHSVIVEIGGPEQLSYKDLIARYAAFTGKKPILILVPIVPLWLGAWWLNLFTPRRHAKVGRQMAESLMNPMVVTNNRAKELFPDIKPESIEKAFSK
ncbi:MAG TPA: NAD(P)H-binding protein [Candidatus Saccharimonadales bacterium]